MPLNQRDWKRLKEIQEELGDLFMEAKRLIQMSGDKHEYDRASGYWLAYLDNAIDQPKSPLLPCTMGDTLAALKPSDIEDEDEEDSWKEIKK